MNILGLSLGILSTAALSRGNKIIACASEERFSRLKNDEAFPLKAIKYCLEEGGIKGNELDAVVIGGKQLNLNTHLMRKYSKWSINDHFDLQNKFWKPKLLNDEKIDFNKIFEDKIDINQYPGPKKWKKLLSKISANYNSLDDINVYNSFIHDLIVDVTGVKREKIHHMDHHQCHAAYAYWASPIRGENTLIMTADAYGDGKSTTLSTIGASGGIAVQHEVDANEFQLGRIYRSITLLMGMMPDAHEFKVMGMAPYTKEPIMRNAYNVFKKGMYVDGLNFKYDERPSDLFFYFKERLEQSRFDGIAGALQQYSEDILLDYTKNAIAKYNCDKLVFSGGISMNVKANMLIKDLPEINDMFVAPSGGDESLSIGACYAYLDHIQNNRDLEPLDSGYLGPDVNKKDMDLCISSAKEEGFFIDSSNDSKVADLLVKGKVIGRCVGRAEFGARSLGNRSIIADPRNRRIVNVINEKVKNRDFWMPFAPSVMTEAVDDLIINPKNLFSPYMTIAFESTNKGAEMLVAGSHPADATIRPQMVSSEMNEDYHSIISHFRQKTDVGGILNTSFNLHGHPIVNTASDAYDVFKKTDIDILLFKNFLISKTEL
tara:strand:- start:24712 stop:26517 length:1806 start_codon:yes stop_codon:yes gene_type:complete